MEVTVASTQTEMQNFDSNFKPIGPLEYNLSAAEIVVDQSARSLDKCLSDCIVGVF